MVKVYLTKNKKDFALVNFLKKNKKENNTAFDDIKDVIQGESLKKVNMDPLDLTSVVKSDKKASEISKPHAKIKSIKTDSLPNYDYKENKGKGTADAKNLTLEQFFVTITRIEITKWLNTHMPDIVKKAVDQEIKKILDK